MTAIARRWEGGEHRRCRLCRECSIAAEYGSATCVVWAEGGVEDDEAPLYRSEREALADWPPAIRVVG